jgi:sulfhydrogenase subunit beta (sulfur reductase)
VGLVSRSYQVIGPTLREGTIVYDTLSGLADLPAGWTDRQDAGNYRLDHRSDRALFGYVVGPHSWKRFFHPPFERMWQARREADCGFVVFQAEEAAPKLAFIGVRSCEVHANAIRDRVLIDGPYPDPAYRSRRHNDFIVAVNCGQASGACFCVSMDTGPKVEAGFGLALTDLINGEDHQFLVEVGSAIGSAVPAELPRGSASLKQLDAADAVVARTAGQMGRIWIPTSLRNCCRATRRTSNGTTSRRRIWFRSRTRRLLSCRASSTCCMCSGSAKWRSA